MKKYLFSLVLLLAILASPVATYAALVDDLVSYWAFDEVSGPALDSQAGNDLTNNNSTAYSTAKIANGADMERSSANYFSITDGAQIGLDLGPDFTLSCWVNYESFANGQDMGFINKFGASGNRPYRIFHYQTSGVQHMYVETSSDGSGSTAGDWAAGTDYTALSTGTFYMITFTKSGTTGKLWIDADDKGSKTLTATIYNGTAQVEIGANGGGGDNLDGFLDECGIWSRALEEAEIVELYNAGAGLAYPFDGGGEEEEATTTPSSAEPDDVRDLFYGIVIFMVSFWFPIWLFRRPRT